MEQLLEELVKGFQMLNAKVDRLAEMSCLLPAPNQVIMKVPQDVYYEGMYKALHEWAKEHGIAEEAPNHSA